MMYRVLNLLLYQSLTIVLLLYLGWSFTRIGRLMGHRSTLNLMRRAFRRRSTRRRTATSGVSW